MGCLAVAAGCIGVVVPGLPTTPFLLLASWLFYRSSPRLRQWLLASWLGAYIRNYERNGGLSVRGKLCAVGLMAVMVTVSAVWLVQSAAVRIVIVAAGCVGCAVVMLVVPTARRK